MPRLVTATAKCPFCREAVGSLDPRCEQCGRDLALLATLRGLPFALYNEAITDLDAGDEWGAVEKLLSAVTLFPRFQEGRELLVEVATSLGLEALVARHADTG